MKILILAALGVTLLVFAPWVLVRVARRYGTDDVPIAPPVPKFTGSDESLRVRTDARRRHAESIRTHAARVDSGDRAVERIRLVR